MVKIEFNGKDAHIIEHLISNNIPVCSHIGVLPQTISNRKDYKKVGKTKDEANKLISEAILIEKSGSQILIVECIDSATAKIISKTLDIPVIGIGSGKNCDGQIRVIYDLFNISFNGMPGFINQNNSQPNHIKKILDKYILDTNRYKA